MSLNYDRSVVVIEASVMVERRFKKINSVISIGYEFLLLAHKLLIQVRNNFGGFV